MALAVASAATTWVALLSWRGFTEHPSGFLEPLVVLGAGVAVTGAVGRWWRWPGAVVLLAQLGVATVLLSLLWTGSPLPLGGALETLEARVRGGFAAANEYAAPVPETETGGVHPVLVLAGLGCMLLVDLLACALRRVPLAGLPLLAVYSVPIGLLGGGLTWWVFAVTAAGFLAMLYLHEDQEIERWGRAFGTDQDEVSVRTGAARTTAGAVGGVATALAITVPLLVPTAQLHLLDIGQGPGGDGDVKVHNPMADLRRDLVLGEDVALVRVTTDDPDPRYLRIAVLNRFSEEEWTAGDRSIPIENRPEGRLPPPLGVSSQIPRSEYRYQVSTTDDFDSTWLPTQFPVSAVEADGDWRYDESTMDFIASDDDLTAAGMDYTMTALKLQYDSGLLTRAPTLSDDVDEALLDLPVELPQSVRDLAIGVTSEASSKYAKAAALQQWFREDGGFTYSLQRAPNGSGAQDLESFLSTEPGGRTGYCEQFAAAMAVMARVLGIPARVAVGFLRPDRVGEDVWEYSAHDLHSWPELYFPGSGWVLFDPTPPDRVASVPGYTTATVPPIIDPVVPSQPSASNAVPSRSPGDPKNSESAAPQTEERAAGADSGGVPWLGVLGAVAAGMLVLLLALVPRMVRARRRDRRRSGGPEEAWEELRDTATDLGLGWPQGRTPRETRDRLARMFGAPQESEDLPERPATGAHLAPDAGHALDRIVTELELLRYSRGHANGRPLGEDVEVVSEALGHGVAPRTRRRAAWWPRSVLRLRRRPSGPPEQQTTDERFGGVVEHVGA